MSKAARSLFVFACYLALIGLVLLVHPNLLLRTVGFAPTQEVWIRVVGMLLLHLASYYYWAAREGWIAFVRITVPARFSVILLFGAFVAFGYAPPTLLLFGAVDFASAIWTFWALRESPSPALV